MINVFFKDKEFVVEKGKTHPDYSYFTFKDEYEFRNKYWNIKSNDIVFDIGASYGSYTLTACAMGATVFSFEPEKSVFNDLVKNVDLNSWQDRCFTYNIGFWDQIANVDMKSYAPHWPAYCISGDYSMTTLDSFVRDNKLTKIDWMKIDVEGAEEKVIKGGLEIIKKFKPKLIIECHSFLDDQLVNKVKNLLCPLDYRFEEIPRDPCIMLVSY